MTPGWIPPNFSNDWRNWHEARNHCGDGNGKPRYADRGGAARAADAYKRQLLQAVAAGVETAPDEALVLMGHGTPHFCNTVYAAMDYHAKAAGLSHVFVGTVEAFPDLDTLIAAVRRAGYRRVVLAPLMLVAGDHANNDMASDAPDSWKTRFSRAGLPARAVIRGLGEYPPVLELYESHLHSIL